MTTQTSWFHDYEPRYDLHVRQFKAKWPRRPVPFDRKGYYRDLLQWTLKNMADNFVIRCVNAGVELAWEAAGRPYYRVYPDYAAIFAKSSLEIPLALLRAPFKSQAVRFQNGAEPVFDGIKVRSFLVGMGSARDWMASYATEADVAAYEKDFPESIPATNSSTANIIAIAVKPDGTVFTPSLALRWQKSAEDATIAEYLERVKTLPQTAETAEAVRPLYGLWPIALSVCYLATNSDYLIEPDVINAEFASYLKAVNTKQWDAAAALVDKSTAARKGRLGFTVGRAESLLGRKAGDRPDCDVGSGSPLLYRHVRKSHERRIWNADRTAFRIVTVRETTVRPDLPPMPGGRAGAHTLDSKDTEKKILEGR